MEYSSRFNAPFTEAERKLAPLTFIKKIQNVVKVVEKVILGSPVGTYLLDYSMHASSKLPALG